MSFGGRHVIVTGGTSGIGRATARLLAQRGAHVSVIARRQDLLDETLEELESLRRDAGQRFAARSADLGSWEQAENAMTALISDGYPPAYLINAAGYCHPGYFADLPIDVFRDTMHTDYFGTVFPIKAVVHTMVERREGHIVNFSSVAGFYAIYGFTPYSAAKFAVTGFSEALRQEMRPYGIRVSVVFPPTTLTPGLERENRTKPAETWCIEGQVKARTADEVAEAVLRGVEKRRRYILPGLDTKAYFLLAHLPPAIRNVFHWFFVDRVIDRVHREQGGDHGGA